MNSLPISSFDRHYTTPVSPSGGKRSDIVPDPAKKTQDQKQIAELQKRDREVRAHEQAHLAAAGGLAVGGASFTYQYGPDGKQYAVGGEVSISVTAGKTPEETLRIAQQIRAAALAPADPSSQDRAVAGYAAQLASKAQQELAQKESATTGQQIVSQGNTPDNRTQETTDATKPLTGSAREGIASYTTNKRNVLAGKLLDVIA